MPCTPTAPLSSTLPQPPTLPPSTTLRHPPTIPHRTTTGLPRGADPESRSGQGRGVRGGLSRPDAHVRTTDCWIPIAPELIMGSNWTRVSFTADGNSSMGNRANDGPLTHGERPRKVARKRSTHIVGRSRKHHEHGKDDGDPGDLLLVHRAQEEEEEAEGQDDRDTDKPGGSAEGYCQRQGSRPWSGLPFRHFWLRADFVHSPVASRTRQQQGQSANRQRAPGAANSPRGIHGGSSIPSLPSPRGKAGPRPSDAVERSITPCRERCKRRQRTCAYP